PMGPDPRGGRPSGPHQVLEAVSVYSPIRVCSRGRGRGASERAGRAHPARWGGHSPGTLPHQLLQAGDGPPRALATIRVSVSMPKGFSRNGQSVSLRPVILLPDIRMTFI